MGLQWDSVALVDTVRLVVLFELTLIVYLNARLLDAQLLHLHSLLSFLYNLYPLITMFCCLYSLHQVSEVLVMLIAPPETRALLFIHLAFKPLVPWIEVHMWCLVLFSFSLQAREGCLLGLQAAVFSLTDFWLLSYPFIRGYKIFMTSLLETTFSQTTYLVKLLVFPQYLV